MVKHKKNIPSHIIYAIILALGLTCANYFVDNSPILNYLNIRMFQRVQKILNLKQNYNYDDVIFINTSYDNQLITAYETPRNKDINEKIIGNSIITDRLKLYKFLNLLNKTRNYKYVLLNIRFDKDDTTEYDNLLFDLIEHMSNIVYAESANDIHIVRPELKKKAAPAEYTYTIEETNFIKYEYITNNKHHLPLKVFEDIHPEKKIKQYGWEKLSLYFSQGNLCQNSLFLTFNRNPFTEYNDSSQKYYQSKINSKNFYNMGSDFLDLLDNMYTESEMIKKIALITKGKYVVIGNMTENIHDSYIGSQPGSLILFRALQALDKKKYCSNIHSDLDSNIFLISLILFKKKSIVEYIFKGDRYKSLYYYLDTFSDFFSFTTLLIICQTLEFICCKSVHSIICPVLCFTFFKYIIHYKKYKYYEPQKH